MGNVQEFVFKIESRVITAHGNQKTCYDVMIDNGLGRDTTFIFSWVHDNSLLIEITNDDGSNTAAVQNSNMAAAYRCTGECVVSYYIS